MQTDNSLNVLDVNKKSDVDRPDTQQKEDIGKQAIYTLRIMLFIGVVAIFIYSAALQARVRTDAYAIPNTVIEPIWQVIGIGLAIAGAALMIGGFLGFLFGIPRTGTVIEADVHGNTNLEQISDWLTKILVGVGLTQISEIPTFLEKLSAALETNLGHAPGSSAFGLGIVFYFLICGFLVGFLWARLYLGHAFREADSIKELKEQINVANKQLDVATTATTKLTEQTGELTEQIKQLGNQPELNALAKQLVDIQLEPRNDTTPPRPSELDQAIAAATTEVRSEIGDLARKTRKQAWGDGRNINFELLDKIIPVYEALIKTDPEHKNYLWQAQLAFALKDKQPPDYKRAESLLTSAIVNRGSPKETGFLWYEINRALCLILQDANFKQKKPSNNSIKQRIMDDLKVSFNEWSVANPVVQDIEDWLKLNNLTHTDFQS